MTDRADRVADSTIRNPLFIVFVLVILLVGVAIVPVVQSGMSLTSSSRRLRNELPSPSRTR
jgi:hypothetical protein